jgi:hypothetical protein
MKPKGMQFDAAALAGKLSDPEQGGFTVNPRTGEDVTSGISVAPRENEAKFRPASPGDIDGYAAANHGRFDKSSATMLGGWRGPDNTDYLDTPTVHPKTPGGGGEARARSQMVMSHQIAGFDLDTFEEKHNPFHPVGRQEMGKESHELADAAQPKEGESMSRAKARSAWVAKQPETQAWINSPRGQSSDPT